MAKKKVLITGGTGYVAGRMLPALRERYDVTILDVKTTNRAGDEVDGAIVVDVLNKDRDTYREYFKGQDAVIHCGFMRAKDPADRFWAEMNNVDMSFNVYQTCIEENVPRAVVISSNHAADYYENLIWAGKQAFVTPDDYPLSDNYYGWAKASYELLGFTFAVGLMNDGKRLENVQLRVGGPRETDIDRASADSLKKMHRGLGAYLSVRDQVQLVVKSIEKENIDNKHGVPFQIFYGISGNSHNFWTISNAQRVIGYEPEDNSQVKFADKVSEVILDAQKSYPKEA
ncbi:MAG: NAD(P)-dependent oxidoreductase [Candidatus Latescibacteria bacterium]|jgi:nucleoside-diphosphate-sugar epimerase|nr:NAD(P)-dependent oxidoreductase [Candidatus Latescibacterota bacterium]MBT4136550.1 NAD(P)-dependent oxidoreductase [Candidatus Latescibacterota bacterium]MBT5828967.1 NAD(P)-dependent oxidoreductase [Candidatus Latescibacterota bacterium]